MKQKPATIDAGTVRRASDFAKTTGEATVAKALKFLDDPDRIQRIRDSQCKTCYYILRSRLGGPNVTERPCGICGQDEIYDTTTTDPICFNCAVKNELCKRCGGDVHMRPRRMYRAEEREQPKPLTRPA